MRFLGVLLATALLAAGCGSDEMERASATSDARQLLGATVDATNGSQQGAVKLHGPFEVGEKGDTPRFALSAELTAEGRTESAGVTSTGDAAFATLKGTTYE